MEVWIPVSISDTCRGENYFPSFWRRVSDPYPSFVEREKSDCAVYLFYVIKWNDRLPLKDKVDKFCFEIYLMVVR